QELLALLPQDFDPNANFAYYEPRCGHGSSLSRPMHALVAARLGDTALALRYFHEAAAMDLGHEAGVSAGGIHIAGLGGLWQVAIRGFAGLSWREEGLSFDPNLPASWRSIGFRVQWRGRRLKVRVEQAGPVLSATLELGAALTLSVGGEPYALSPGR